MAFAPPGWVAVGIGTGSPRLDPAALLVVPWRRGPRAGLPPKAARRIGTAGAVLPALQHHSHPPIASTGLVRGRSPAVRHPLEQVQVPAPAAASVAGLASAAFASAFAPPVAGLVGKAAEAWAVP